jgi:chemotaxis protein methyltransferase CheR
MALQLLASDYYYLRDLVNNRCGLDLDSKQRDDIERVLEKLIKMSGASGLHSLLLTLYGLPTHDPLWQEFINNLTIGETYFFRNIDQFNALRWHVLPELIAQRRASNFLQLRLWSAGCATGEEPYSLAILIRQMLPDYHNWIISILATDINGQFIDYARRGVYRSRSFRNETPDTLREEWFSETPQGWEIHPSVRSMVKFGLLNFLADDYPSYETGTVNMDIIVCRNVTIYFKTETTRKIVERFHTALNERGWLIVGHSEPMASVYQNFAARNFENTVFYQKLAPNEIAPQIYPFPAAATPRSVPTPVPEPQIAPATPAPQPQTWEQAKSAADREDWQTALRLLNLAEQENRMQPQIYYLRALIQLHNHDVDGAYQSLRQVVYCDPTFALAHYSLGEFHEQRGETKEAARHWRAAQKAIATMQPDAFLPFSDDLTVEILSDLLEHRLSALNA